MHFFFACRYPFQNLILSLSGFSNATRVSIISLWVSLTKVSNCVWTLFKVSITFFISSIFYPFDLFIVNFNFLPIIVLFNFNNFFHYMIVLKNQYTNLFYWLQKLIQFHHIQYLQFCLLYQTYYPHSIVYQNDYMISIKMCL